MKVKHSSIARVLLAAVAAATIFTACKKDEQESTWDKYADWRETNDEWIAQQAALRDNNGRLVYERVTPVWDPNAYVLMRWLTPRVDNPDRWTPIYTSTVDVKYIGYLYNKVPFDSSYTSVTPADSVARFQISNLVPGWAIAMERMRVGDSVEVIIPWEQAYGAKSTSAIPPFSALRFAIKLVGVPGEYVRP